MKTFPLAKVLGILALAGTIVPAVLFAFRLMGEDAMKFTLLAATFLWFAVAPVWLKGGDH